MKPGTKESERAGSYADRRQRWPRRIVVVAILVAFGLLAMVDLTAGSASPSCSVCHAPQHVALIDSVHADVSCLSCHLDNGWWSLPEFKLRQWIGMYPRQLFGGTWEPERPVPRGPCETCHRSVAEGGVVGSAGLRITHDACAPAPTRCDGCHGAVSHGDAVRWGGQPVMEECVACHESSGAVIECDTCHTGRLQVERLRRGPWRVTHGPEWQSTHAMGSYDACGTCHPSDYCERCHGVGVPHPATFGSEHGGLSLAEGALCEQCHSRESFCDACHGGVEMPHGAGYLAAHVSKATAADDPRCIRCHTERSCYECHVRHVHPGGASFDDQQRGATQ